MHDWSETEFDWQALNGACDIIMKYAIDIGHNAGQVKEKWGTLRFYAHFPEISFHSLVYPGYIYCQYKYDWMWKLDWKLRPALQFLFGKLYFRWQKYWYNYAYQLAVKTYPHIAKEILQCADYPDFIKNYKELRGE